MPKNNPRLSTVVMEKVVPIYVSLVLETWRSVILDISSTICTTHINQCADTVGKNVMINWDHMTKTFAARIHKNLCDQMEREKILLYS